MRDHDHTLLLAMQRSAELLSLVTGGDVDADVDADAATHSHPHQCDEGDAGTGPPSDDDHGQKDASTDSQTEPTAAAPALSGSAASRSTDVAATPRTALSVPSASSSRTRFQMFFGRSSSRTSMSAASPGPSSSSSSAAKSKAVTILSSASLDSTAESVGSDALEGSESSHFHRDHEPPISKHSLTTKTVVAEVAYCLVSSEPIQAFCFQVLQAVADAERAAGRRMCTRRSQRLLEVMGSILEDAAPSPLPIPTRAAEHTDQLDIDRLTTEKQLIDRDSDDDDDDDDYDDGVEAVDKEGGEPSKQSASLPAGGDASETPLCFDRRRRPSSYRRLRQQQVQLQRRRRLLLRLRAMSVPSVPCVAFPFWAAPTVLQSQ